MTTRSASTHEAILQNDHDQAVAAAETRVIAESCELAPLSYAALRALRGTAGLGELLAALADELVRPQVVRFLVERRAETGALWGWGDVDEVERRFRRLIGEARAAELAARIGRAQAAKIAQMIREETTVSEPETDPDGGYTLPAPALVREALARLATTAQAAGDTANANAFNRADYQISRGIYPVVTVSADGALLVPSKETAGTVYRVGETGCSCVAGQKGKPCWHAALFEAMLVAREEVAAARDDDDAYADSLLTLDPGQLAA